MIPHARQPEDHRRLWEQLRSSHPRFCEAVAADVRVALINRAEPRSADSGPQLVLQALRLAWASDAFLAQILYRGKARMQALGVPILPRLAHRLAILIAQVSIGDPVVVAPGVYIPHGQVVVDGLIRIGSGVVLSPFVTIGLKAGEFAGPVIEDEVHVGTGAKIIGPVRVHSGARIGAGAIVVDDVAANATVVGAPARAR